MQNIDKKVVDDFGFEWDKFDHSELSENELKEAFEQYFGIFPLEELINNLLVSIWVVAVEDGQK